MEYSLLEGAGVLSVKYEGPPFDLRTLGALQTTLQSLIDSAAEEALVNAGLLPNPFFWDETGRLRDDRASFRSPYPIRAEVTEAQSGSWFQEIVLRLSPIISQQNVHDVLSGVAGNVVYAIGRWAIASRRGTLDASTQEAVVPPETIFSSDPSRKIRKLMKALAQNADGREASLTVEERHPNGNFVRVSIAFGPG